MARIGDARPREIRGLGLDEPREVLDVHHAKHLVRVRELEAVGDRADALLHNERAGAPGHKLPAGTGDVRKLQGVQIEEDAVAGLEGFDAMAFVVRLGILFLSERCRWLSKSITKSAVASLLRVGRATYASSFACISRNPRGAKP